MIGTEKEYRAEFHGFRFKGYIDRIDSLAPGQVRVSDYKTGKVTDDDIFIDDGNALEVAAAVFGDDNSRRPKIALQFFIYDMLLRKNGFGDDILNSVYQTSRLFSEKIRPVPLSVKFYEAMESGLAGLLDEISDKGIPFRRTDSADICSYCDFKKICGR